MRVLVVLLAASVFTTGCAVRQYRLDVSSGAQGLTRITSDPENEFGPKISPDGKTVIFDTRLARAASIVGVDPQSGAKRTVYTTPSSRAQDAAWDPGGKFFVYTSNSSGAWSLVRSLTNSPSAAVSIIVSGEMAPIVSYPDISPDGKSVAFATRVRGSWSVAIARLDGSNLTFMGEGTSPAWSPDGKKIAFVRTANRRAHVYTMDAMNGTDIIQVTNGDHDNLHPTWSPDGSLIAFVSNRAKNKVARIFDAATGDTYAVRGGSWGLNLFAVRADGTGFVQLTDGDGVAVQPHWSRDGWIYFSSNQGGNFDIWRLRPPNTQAPR